MPRAQRVTCLAGQSKQRTAASGAGAKQQVQEKAAKEAPVKLPKLKKPKGSEKAQAKAPQRAAGSGGNEMRTITETSREGSVAVSHSASLMLP